MSCSITNAPFHRFQPNTNNMSSESSSNNSINVIPMLNGGNYPEWSARMKAYLHWAKLWPYVNGTNAQPSDQTTAEYKTWNESDEQAIGAMLMKIPYQYHHLAKATATSDRTSMQSGQSWKLNSQKLALLVCMQNFLLPFTFMSGKVRIRCRHLVT